MQKVLLGLVMFFIIIALLFNFAQFFDYTYTGDTYDVDFVTPTKINSSLLQTSFTDAFSFFEGVVGFVTDSFRIISAAFDGGDRLLLVGGDSDFLEFFEERIEYAKKYKHTIKWYNFYDKLVKADAVRTSAEALVFGELLLDSSDSTHYTYLSHIYSIDSDINEFSKYCGWSDKDIERIHEYCVKNKRTHTYNGVLYDYR